MSGRSKVLFIAFLLIILGLGGFFGLRHRDRSSGVPSRQSAAYDGQLQSGEYVIKDLGIRFPLPDQLKGLRATSQKSPANVSPAVAVVELHLQSYTDVANKCLGTPSSTPQSFAILSTALTVNGSLPPGAKSLKQFKNFYVTNLGPSVPSSIKCQDKLTQQKLDDLSGQLNKALAQAFAGAQTL